MYALILGNIVVGHIVCSASMASAMNDAGPYTVVECAETPINGSTYDPTTGVITPPAAP